MITEKGRGYTPAEEDIADRFHAVGPIHPETGLPVAPERFGWTGVFADEICAQAARRDDIVGITAAMMRPVGLGPMHEAYPGRVIDVGIAEAEAVASAAGMAYEGAHPVVALYATFLNRGFDQLLMDVALHRAGVTLVLDRAGVTGADGASHNGVWDIAMCSLIPGLRLAAPRDEDSLRSRVREALDVDDAPTVIRYRKGSLPKPMPALRSVGGVDILFDEAGDPSSDRVLIVGTGACAPDAIKAARRLVADGVSVTVADPQWMIPISPDLVSLAGEYDCVVSVEDGIVQGGFGWSLRDALAEARVPVRCLGVPQGFPEHGDRAAMIARFGYDADGIESAVRELLEHISAR
jgi:1-deoxy-D-xylulose-5-phosphate synthase